MFNWWSKKWAPFREPVKPAQNGNNNKKKEASKDWPAWKNILVLVLCCKIFLLIF